MNSSHQVQPRGAVLENRFEYATAADPALNYCLWEYAPRASAEDKFRSINLLLQSFDHSAVHSNAYQIIDAIRSSIGSFRTVFGIKQLPGGELAWEFYFYDYGRLARDVSATKVLAAISPWVKCGIEPNEQLPYFMFSLDFGSEVLRGARPMDTVHMYIGNPGSAVSSGIAYALRDDGLSLENFYFFFDARKQLHEAAEKIGQSVFFDASRFPVEAVLLPELSSCETICVANKQSHDCVYFSGVDIDQLILFMDRLGYPEPMQQFARNNRSSLDHLLFDVGIDFRVEQGKLVFLKSGYYGVF